MIVALVIGLILTFTAVMPLVSDYSDAKTFTNEGIVRMSKLTTSDVVNASWDHTDPYNFTVNSEKVALPQTVSVWSLTVSGGDHEFMIRYIPNDNTYGTYLTVFSETNANVSAGTVAGTDLTLTIDHGSISVTNGTNTNTNTFSEYMFIVSNDGNYVMKSANDKAYVLKDSDIHGIGRTWLAASSNNINLQVDGTIKDGFTVSIPESVEATISDITVTDSEVSGYIDLYQFDKIDFKVTYNDLTSPVSYSQVIVPYKVSADPDNPAAYKNLVSVLPLFALILLVAGAASLVYFKNKD